MLKRTTKEKGYALEILEEEMTPNPGGEQVAVTFRFRKLHTSEIAAAEKGEGTTGSADSGNGAAICANRQNEATCILNCCNDRSAASERESRFCFQRKR